jgi:hypothetical protein
LRGLVGRGTAREVRGRRLEESAWEEERVMVERGVVEQVLERWERVGG